MKKKFFNMIALLLFITGVQASCNKEDSPVTSPGSRNRHRPLPAHSPEVRT